MHELAARARHHRVPLPDVDIADDDPKLRLDVKRWRQGDMRVIRSADPSQRGGTVQA